MLKTLVNFAILTTIVIAVWIFVSVFDSFTSTTISGGIAEKIKPIAPTFDTNAIQILQQRTFIPTDLGEVIIPTATGSALNTEPEAKSTITPTPTTISTSSGTLIPSNF